MLTRSANLVKFRGNIKTRELVGKVTAPAGLLSFTVNDLSLPTDESGLFKTEVALLKERTPVSLVAVDRQGKRATLDFTVSRFEIKFSCSSVDIQSIDRDTSEPVGSARVVTELSGSYECWLNPLASII